MIAPIRPARLLPLILLAQAAFAAGADPAQTPATPPIFDAHVHYSHDAWANLPPADAIAILRKAGIKRALVSSSGDEGTQRLVALAPDLIIAFAASLPHARRRQHLGPRRHWSSTFSRIA